MKKRILIISYWFPPFQVIGAMRLATFAKYLTELGWDVAVITVKDSKVAFNGRHTTVEPLPYTVYRLPGFSWSELFKFITFGRLKGNTTLSTKTQKSPNILKKWCYKLYHEYLSFPDECWTWYWLNKKKACKIAEKFQPDIILSSAMPFSSHVLAAHIQHKLQCPWVADYRDPWTGYAFRNRSNKLEKQAIQLEKNILKNASLITTVSEPWGSNIGQSLTKPYEVLYNGFESDDYSQNTSIPKDNVFRIAYTGMIYEGLQSPEIFFEGLQLFIEKENVKEDSFCFYYCGQNAETLRNITSRLNLNNYCEIHNYLPHADAVELQLKADILLFLTFSVKGWLSGKLMEYMGTDKPILAVGPEEKESKKILCNTKKGVQVSSPQDVADQLSEYYNMKQNNLPLSSPPCIEFTRENQAKKLDLILRELLISNEIKE